MGSKAVSMNAETLEAKSPDVIVLSSTVDGDHGTPILASKGWSIKGEFTPQRFGGLAISRHD